MLFRQRVFVIEFQDENNVNVQYIVKISFCSKFIFLFISEFTLKKC